MKLLKIVLFLAALAAGAVLAAKFLPDVAGPLLDRGKEALKKGERKVGDDLLDKDRKKLDNIIDGLQKEAR